MSKLRASIVRSGVRFVQKLTSPHSTAGATDQSVIGRQVTTCFECLFPSVAVLWSWFFCVFSSWLTESACHVILLTDWHTLATTDRGSSGSGVIGPHSLVLGQDIMIDPHFLCTNRSLVHFYVDTKHKCHRFLHANGSKCTSPFHFN